MSSSSAPPGSDRDVLRRIVLRVLLALVLLALFLFGLVYCTTHTGRGDGGSATPALPTFSNSATASAPATTAASPTRPAATGTATPAVSGTGAPAGKGLTGSKSDKRSKSSGSKSVGAKPSGSKSAAGKSRSGTAPRSAPNTGGGSASGAVDLRLLTGGVLLLLASVGLGSVTFRRWRRAW